MMSFDAPAHDEPTNDAGHDMACNCPECMPELYMAPEQHAEQAKEVA